MLREYRARSLVGAVSATLCLLLIATMPIALAATFAHREVTEYFGDGVFVALWSLVALSLLLFARELLELRRYRSVASYRGPRFEFSPVAVTVLKEIEILLLRGLLPALTAASLFVTVLRLASADQAFEQAGLFGYYVFAYFALFAMVFVALTVRHLYVDQEARNSLAK